MLDTDVAILGGGCAGLSLAVALGQRTPGLRVHVLEERTAYVRDRTWCLWNAEPHAFEDCVTHSWNRWRVRSRDRTVLCQSARYFYQHIPADRFYTFARKSIDASCRQQITLGTRVISVVPKASIVHVETDRGSLSAAWVFDSRPQAAITRPQTKGLVQRFSGWHVITERPCFDPTTVELMDFQTSNAAGRTTFFYTLPFSSNEALVEATYLDRPSLVPANANAALCDWLETLTAGSAYRIEFRERGVLPMGPARGIDPDPRHTRHQRIGIAGGRVKASSGYAFLRIQRQSRAIANALAQGRVPPKHFEPGRYRLLDSIFLAALLRRQEAAPDYFLQLFRNVPPDVLVRFLSESGSASETLQVTLALPKLPFAAAAAASMLGAPA